MKCKSPSDYMAQFNQHQTDLSVEYIENLTFEFMLNALRLKEGFSSELFEQENGM